MLLLTVRSRYLELVKLIWKVLWLLICRLLSWMEGFGNGNSLLIHLSTDQVYEGVKSFYKEEDAVNPVNMYGKSKVAAEQFIYEKYSNFAILRSSIIYWPQTTSPVTKSLQIQWINSILIRGDEAEFIHDEYRCPVYVNDVVTVIHALIKKWISDEKKMKLLLNVGGPDGLSWVQIAEAVADVRGYNQSLIIAVSASMVNRGVASPADISVDTSRLIQVLVLLQPHLKMVLDQLSKTWLLARCNHCTVIFSSWHRGCFTMNNIHMH